MYCVQPTTYRVISIEKRILVSLVMIFFTYSLYAKDNSEIDDKKVKFSSHVISVKQALDELNKIDGINIIYGGTELYLTNRIDFSKREMLVSQALDIMERQAPIEILFKNGYLIVKQRKLDRFYKLNGQVKDAKTGEALIAATIIISGTLKGTATNTKGGFDLNLKPNTYQVECSYMGYKTKQQTVNLYSNTAKTIYLEPVHHEIQGVNITGFRTEDESFDEVRPVEQIEGKTISQLNINNVNDALHGRINGVWTTRTSGAPGDHYKVRIRGINSLFGSADPLYVVDGMMIPQINLESMGIGNINTHDVEGIKVLKDASSTARYGYLGGNGVIIITTNKGAKNPGFNISVNRGYQQFDKRYQLMDINEFYGTLKMSDDIIKTAFYKSRFSSDMQPKYPEFNDSVANQENYADFQDIIFRTGEITEVQFSGSGNKKGTSAYISGNYFTHKGVVVNSSYTRYSVLGNLNQQVKDKLSINLQYRGTLEENKNNLDNYLGNNVVFKGINYEPAYHFTADSFLTQIHRLYVGPSENYENIPRVLDEFTITPDSLFFYQEKNKKVQDHNLNLNFEYSLFPWLDIRANLSYSGRQNKYYSRVMRSNSLGYSTLKSSEKVNIFSQQLGLHLQSDPTKAHNVEAEFSIRNFNDRIAWQVDTIDDQGEFYTTEYNELYLRGSQAVYGESGSVVRSLSAIITGIIYNYRKRYYLSLLANYDFLTEGYTTQRSSVFPSGALMWNLANESFLEKVENLNELQLSATWGKVGNYPLNSLSNDIYSANNTYSAGEQETEAVYLSGIANHNLTHEQISEFNYSISTSAFDNKIGLKLNLFTRYHSNLLVQSEKPLYYGGGLFYQNIGEMKNQGYEFTLEFTPIRSPLVIWYSTIGYSTGKQKITKLYNTNSINFGNDDYLFPDFFALEGNNLGVITGYKYLGKTDNIQEEINRDPANFITAKGFVYQNADTTFRGISEDDKVVIGNSIPKYTINWFNSLSIKNLILDMHWYGAFNFDKYNATRASTFLTGVNRDVQSFVSDTISAHTNYILYESSFFVEDASFIRLKTLSFTYRQPRKIASRISLAYTLSFENLITISRYSGYDPEATIYTGNNFSENAVDRGAYPNPRGVFFKISATL